MLMWRQVLENKLKALRWHALSGTICLLLAVLTLSGVMAPIDRVAMDLGFSVRSRPIAEDVVLVEIDQASLAKLDRWPWSRAYHAALIQRLSDAGAQMIAFDIDFSSQSSPSADKALADSISRSKSEIILATFARPSVDGSGALRQILPLPMFRKNSRIASVNMMGESDGSALRYGFDVGRPGDAVPTMASVLSRSEATSPNRFVIDYSIDPGSLSRISYVDVITGHFDRASVAGKKVLVGATAMELGDHFAVPKHRMLSGVEIQALAYSTLSQNRAIIEAGAVWALFALGVTAFGLLWIESRRRSLLYPAGIAAVAALVGYSVFLQDVYRVAVSFAPALLAALLLIAVAFARDARRHARAAVNQRALARRHKALMRGVFNDTGDGIIITDADGLVEMANAAAARILECQPAALLGTRVSDIVPGLLLQEGGGQQSISMTSASMRQLSLGVATSRTITGSAGRGDGRDRAAWIVTFRDESVRRAMEMARDATIRELQLATAAKSEFLSRISHELRTPLNAIIGFAGIIGDQRGGPIGHQNLEYAGHITAGGKRLLEIVNDVIDVVRLEAGQYPLRPDLVEVRGILGACCAAAQQSESAVEKTMQCEVSPGAEAIDADPQALTKIISKLLDNALKFAGPEGKISLRASLNDNMSIAIEVEDNGPGIPPAALKNLATAFTQVQGGLSRRHEGTGLGLYLASRLASAMDGKLEIHSVVGQGTVVRLTLPGSVGHRLAA